MSTLTNTNTTTSTKRTRISRACHACQTKKIRCDGIRPACSYCSKHRMRCVFTRPEKPPSIRKGGAYIEALETTLGRMESLLHRSGLLPEEEKTLTNLQKQKSGTEKAESTKPPTPPNPRTKELDSNSPSGPAPDHGSASPEILDNMSYDGTVSSDGGRLSHVSLSNANRNIYPSSIVYDFKSNSPDRDMKVMTDIICTIATNNCGDSPNSGSGTCTSIFSPEGMQWVDRKAGGDCSFKIGIRSAVMDNSALDAFNPDPFGDLFNRPVLRQMPSKEEAISVLNIFFDNFNCIYPLFHQPTFMEAVERHYLGELSSNIGWWACLNITLALAHRLRAVSDVVAPDVNDCQKAWDFFKNAVGVLTELTWRSTDIQGVQALLAMAMFMEGTSHPGPSSFLVASAIRLLHSLGLHDIQEAPGLDPMEVEQRRRVFWTAYRLDKVLCLRLGQPMVQTDDDMNVDLPSENPEDGYGNIPLPNGSGKINLFRLFAQLARIGSKVYQQLYSKQASRLSDEERLYRVRELDYDLEEWKEMIPVDFQPESEIDTSHAPLLLHVLVLHFSYYNLAIIIHRATAQHSRRVSEKISGDLEDSSKSVDPRVLSSAALCTSAARASIRLIKYIPPGDYGYIWMVLYYPVSALVTLFGSILENPADPRSKADIRLLDSLVTFLSGLQQEEYSVVRRIHSVCSELTRVARLVVDKAKRTERPPPPSSKRRRRGFEAHLEMQPFAQPVMDNNPEDPPNVHSPGVLDSSHASLQPGDMTLQNGDMFARGFSLASNAFTPSPSIVPQHHSSIMSNVMSPFSDRQSAFLNGMDMPMPWAGNGMQYHFGTHETSFGNDLDFGMGLNQ